MALLISGKTVCPICGNVIGRDNKVVIFPPFVANELDPLFLFSDAAFHEECFSRHPLANMALALFKEMDAKSQPSDRRCVVCTQSINDPDDYVGFGHLTSDESEPLFVYNFSQFHQSCLGRWPDRAKAKRLLQELVSSKGWKGRSLNWVLDRL